MTALLRAWSGGDEAALGTLTPLVYEELHRIARRYMSREQSGHTLQTTALINEAYLRLIGTRPASWENRAHFFAVCAQLMRRILTDFARSRLSRKRGADAAHLSLDETPEIFQEESADWVALDEALGRLAALDPRKSQVVELRFFGGLSAEEAAEVLKISPKTILRDWNLARAWLLREMSDGKHDGA